MPLARSRLINDLHDILLGLEATEVLRGVRFRRYPYIKVEVKGLALERIAGVRNASLLEPAMIYGICSATEMDSSQVSVLQKSV